MAATKTTANETTDQASPSPAAVKQPEIPEKATGPQRVALMAEGSVAPPPPNGAQSPMRSAEMLISGSNGMGAVPRAQMMRSLQRSVGNTRVHRTLGGAPGIESGGDTELAEKLARLKRDEYCEDPKVEYKVARELLTAELMQNISLSPEDKQLLIGIVNGTHRSEPDVVPETPVVTPCNVKTTYTAEDVKTAAWNIVQNEQSVKDAFLFFSGIKSKIPKDKWEEEIAKFFSGEYQPRARLKEIEATGETPNKSGPLKHKKIKLNPKNSFSLAVSTYFHEISHYADIWYSSMAARMKGTHRKEEEGKTGIRPGKSDPSKKQQVSALGESLTAIVEQILSDMQKSVPQPNEHYLVAAYRLRYHQEKETPAFNHDVYITQIRKELWQAATEKYEAWGAKVSDDKITASKVELGYAFEKAAFGFFDPKQKEGEWAVGFNEKFEEKYCKYLQ